MNIFNETVFRINWLKFLDSVQNENPLNSSDITRSAATMIVFLVILSFLMLWFLFYFILSLGLLIVSIYRIFAIRYIKYEFYLNMLVLNRGIFTKMKKIYPYRSFTMVQHVQAVGERIFGIGSLLIHEPHLGVLWISGIENDLILELFHEYSDMLLNNEIRMMEESRSNNIRMKTTVRDKRLNNRELTGLLIPVLNEMNILMNHVFRLIKKRKRFQSI